jgi:SAM-dependent methyltransferase
MSAARWDSWGEDDNALRYDAFARLYPMYRETSRDLVTLARPSGGSTVLDLACGTGVTTEAILSVLGPGGRVIAVDRSPAMLEVAAGAFSDHRIEWVQAAAETVDQHITGQADVAVCNSAIWQTDLAATAAAVRNVLVAEGRFIFNVGSGFLERHDDPNYQGDLPSVMRDIAARDCGWTSLPQTPPRTRPRLTRESICDELNKAGFEVERVEEFRYEDSADAQRAWLSIPIFSKQYLPGLPYAARMHVLEKAFDYLGPGEAAITRWVDFAARASPSERRV